MSTTENTEPCPACGGTGMVEYQDVIGYVTHDMASDACEPEMEGMPMYGPVQAPCPECKPDHTGE